MIQCFWGAVYDVTRKETLSNLEAWLKEVGRPVQYGHMCDMATGKSVGAIVVGCGRRSVATCCQHFRWPDGQVNMYTSKSGVILMLVGNKIDKTANREVTHQVPIQLCVRTCHAHA